MEFCPKCGKLLTPKGEGENIELVCPSCGFVKNPDEGHTKKETQEKKGEDVVVNDGNEINLPQTKAQCSECGNSTAYYWMEQTRAADEAPTRFYKCTKCGNTWREYS